MSEWYDRDGQPIADLMTWAALFERADYKRVAETTLPDGKWVSTVWMGLNHQWGDRPPLIFETMVFAAHGGDEVDCERYSTLAEAEAGHATMVAKWGAATPTEPQTEMP